MDSLDRLVYLCRLHNEADRLMNALCKAAARYYNDHGGHDDPQLVRTYHKSYARARRRYAAYYLAIYHRPYAEED